MIRKEKEASELEVILIRMLKSMIIIPELLLLGNSWVASKISLYSLSAANKLKSVRKGETTGKKSGSKVDVELRNVRQDAEEAKEVPQPDITSAPQGDKNAA